MFIGDCGNSGDTEMNTDFSRGNLVRSLAGGLVLPQSSTSSANVSPATTTAQNVTLAHPVNLAVNLAENTGANESILESIGAASGKLKKQI